MMMGNSTHYAADKFRFDAAFVEIMKSAAEAEVDNFTKVRSSSC